MNGPVELFGGRYRVLEPLGTGGMANVYLAEQTSLHRKVALKILRRDLRGEPTMAARFRREALLLSSVDHPSVVRVLDFEVEAEGAAVVLEYVEGPRLDAVLAGEALGVGRALNLLTQIAQGLAAIHKAGIVHRDLKPENVIIAGQGFDERARVFDFGIARLFSVDAVGGDDKQYISSIGMGVGTPSYVAPEQARGDQVGPPADVYAFGITAYLMLSGELPFKAPSTQELLELHMSQKPKALLQLAPAVASVPGLAEVVHRCLEKKPQDRYADGAELAAALAKLRPPAPVDETMLQTLASQEVQLLSVPSDAPRAPWRWLVPVLLASLLVGAAPWWVTHAPWRVESRAALVLPHLPELALKWLDGVESRRALQLKAIALLKLHRDDEAEALLEGRCHQLGFERVSELDSLLTAACAKER